MKKMQRRNISPANHHKEMHSQNHQNTSKSKVVQLQGEKSSRLGKKTVQKKLENAKPEQYEKILNNLTTQNKMLKQEVQSLKKKVQELLISKKIANNSKKNIQKNGEMEQQIKKAKKQLQLKYYSMNYLKQQLKKYKQVAFSSQVRFKVQQQKQQINNVEEQIKKLTKQKQKLMREMEINKSSLIEQSQYSKAYKNRVASHKEQNRQLKSKIQQLNKGSESKISKPASTEKFSEQKYLNKKISQSYHEDRNEKKKEKTLQKATKKGEQQQNMQNQIKKLKEQKQLMENELQKEQKIKRNKKLRLKKQIQKNTSFHQQLMQYKIKIYNQFHLYGNKGKNYQSSNNILQEKQASKCQCQDFQCQTDNQVNTALRKQWVGKSEGTPFGDSELFLNKNHVYIKSASIYKSPNFIGFVKFFYEDTNNMKYETNVPFDSTLLNNYSCKECRAKDKAYLHSFIVILTNNIITGLSLIWSDGESVFQGNELQNSTKFKADVDIRQRPVSMFGTLIPQKQNLYALESLGCEVIVNSDNK